MPSLRTPPTLQRTCGSCTACCVRLLIPPGIVGPKVKPAGQRCPHLHHHGCKRYASRPQVCADFHCVWLHDPAWRGEWRPDLSGLLCLREFIDLGLLAALVYEIRRDALQEEPAAQILSELRRTAAVVTVVDWRQRRTRLYGFGPQHRVA